MCGLVGFWDFSQATSYAMRDVATQMAARIAHRGPDSADVWQDDHLPLVMAHRRLAIRDLSPRGAQPMVSHCDRWVIVYNGEIYNVDEFTKDLAQRGIFLEGHSDTEALLNAIAVFGLDAVLSKINGMFAFALWDRQDKKLYLVRDRLGIKPLYFGFNHGVFYFGSQLKAFVSHPKWQGEIDYSAVSTFFQFNYIVAPYSIYKNIHKLVPGHYVTIDHRGNINDKIYWSLLEKASLPTFDPRDEKEHLSKLHILLKDAVKRRMIADVPLGAFLSGGIDSSLVVALMQTQNPSPIKTFTIGFNEDEFNEARYAKQVAQHLGTDHHELYLQADDAIKLIPELPKWFDEPFADVSQLPTLLVSKLARQQVIVSLSGDGGDELFAGYNRYFFAYKIYQRILVLPTLLRSLLAKLILSIKPNYWNQIGRVVPQKRRPRLIGDKAHKLARILSFSDFDFYKNLVSFWDPEELMQKHAVKFNWPNIEADDFILKMQLFDTLLYLPDDILTKVDRASMAVGLEARVPLLDYRVVEFAFRLPQEEKIRKNQGKWLLRQILNYYIPSELIDRPKMGFGVPLHQWLRTSLKEWGNNLLSTENLKKSHLNVDLIQRRWKEHQLGVRDWQYALWGVLMYQSWILEHA